MAFNLHTITIKLLNLICDQILDTSVIPWKSYQGHQQNITFYLFLIDVLEIEMSHLDAWVVNSEWLSVYPLFIFSFCFIATALIMLDLMVLYSWLRCKVAITPVSWTQKESPL